MDELLKAKIAHLEALTDLQQILENELDLINRELDLNYESKKLHGMQEAYICVLSHLRDSVNDYIDTL